MNSSTKTFVLLQVISDTDTATVSILRLWEGTIMSVDVPSREKVLDMALAQYGGGKSIQMRFCLIELEVSVHLRFDLDMLTC